MPVKVRVKKSDFPRWRFNVLSPVDSTVIWAYDAFKVEEVHKKWKNDTGNSFLSRAKAVRACNGELNCPFIKCYKIGDWADRHMKRANLPDSSLGVAPNSPTPSEFSTIDDYSTSGETDFETEESDGETTAVENSDDSDLDHLSEEE